MNFEDDYSHIRTIETFDFNWFRKIPLAKRGPGNPRSRRGIKYKNILSAFDIETTRIKEIEQAVMYVWQWCFYVDPDTWVVVIGRTWQDFLYFCDRICGAIIGDKVRLLVFDHNLSYEFQFLRGIYKFSPDDVFALKSRKILKCVMYDKLEFRCSYLQTNMSLDSFTSKYKVQHSKLTGALDYSKRRYWYTKLKPDELPYIINDVVGLCEAIAAEMESDGDNLYTLPLTSTGYVRRDAKKAMKKVGRAVVADILPDYEIYQVLREAFRGGNTHANRYYAGMEVTGTIRSADRSSSYPAVQCCNNYPMTRFFKVRESDLNFDNVIRLITKRHRAVLTQLQFWGVTLKNPYWGCPYIPLSKCRNIARPVLDNGRILSAEYLEISVTDIDLQIIMSEYKFDKVQPLSIYHAKYGRLPYPLINCTINYYKAKTELKGVKGQELYYMKSKNKLNSIYGMMAQDPVKPEILFNADNSDDFTISQDKTGEELLSDYNDHAFLAYQWGVWVTAWARYRLEQGIQLAEQNHGFIYCDTDSVKYVGDVDFSGYNAERIKECKQVGAYAVDPSGKAHYMGVFEQESDMTAFKTLGAKKYVYLDTQGELHLTVAGVGKKKGAAELKKHGGIKAFKEGFVFTDAGGIEAVYNDEPEMCEYQTEDGETIPITANVSLRPSTYQLGITGDYSRLLHASHIDSPLNI